MFLSDRQLKELQTAGVIAPTASIQPASVDLHLGATMKRWDGYTMDPEEDQSYLWKPMELQENGRFFLRHETLHLAPTVESVSVPTKYVAILHGLSSLGRMGLLVHITAGLVDPGNTLIPTLELFSLAGDIWLRPGMRICQISYHPLTSEAEHPYSGKYQGDTLAVPSRMHQEASMRVQESGDD